MHEKIVGLGLLLGLAGLAGLVGCESSGNMADVTPSNDVSADGTTAWDTGRDARPAADVGTSDAWTGDTASDTWTDAPAEDATADTTHPTDSAGATDSSDEGAQPDTSSDTPDAYVPPVPFTCHSGQVVAGWNNNWLVAGKKRSFFAKLPTNVDGPLGVIFVYHGQGDNVDNFKAFFNANPDGDPEFPLVVIYPKSMALQPIGADGGIEWSLLHSDPGDDNPDALFFEEILGCLGASFTIDTSSLFLFGFSAGAIFSNLLHSRYPELLPTVLSMSGAWFNDAATVKAVNTLGMATLGWADLGTAPGTVLMTHGGDSDTYGTMGITIIDFEKSAGYAIPYLTSHGRAVIDCPHTLGHTNHRDVKTADIVRFFKDHRGVAASPYLDDGLPDEFPAGCSLVTPR